MKDIFLEQKWVSEDFFLNDEKGNILYYIIKIYLHLGDSKRMNCHSHLPKKEEKFIIILKNQTLCAKIVLNENR